MDIEWTSVEKADSYEVTYNNLETEHVKTLTGITGTTATLLDLEPASRYQIYVVSIQEITDFAGESQVFPSYTGEPIHGITQIDAPSMVRVIKNGVKNGTVNVMWERVEKANEYRVGIIPRDTVLGTGKYNGTDLEAELTGLDPATEYKIFVIAENTEKGLVSSKRMSQAMTLMPQLYKTKGTGPSTDDVLAGLEDIQIRMNGDQKAISEAEYIDEWMVFGSGDDESAEEQLGGLDPKIMVVIIIGAVLLFILLCLIVPCLIECRRCKSEGHCCCTMFSSKVDEDDEYLGQSSLERQKAQIAGYA